MRFAACVLGVAAVMVVAAPAAAQERDLKAEREREAKAQWAREVVNDFFKAITGAERRQPGANARALLGEELRKEFSLDRPEFAMWQGNLQLVHHGRCELLDGQDEVVFKGRMSRGSGNTADEYDFVARVVKGKDPSVWRIVYLRATEVPKPKAKAEVTAPKK